MQVALLVETLHTIQFSAILGDLAHKTDVYLHAGVHGPAVECLFTNHNQAQYLLDHAPELVPPGNWSPHSLGTFFEHFYYSNISFRVSYHRSLTVLLPCR